jgi:hypothetical protein
MLYYFDIYGFIDGLINFFQLELAQVLLIGYFEKLEDG